MEEYLYYMKTLRSQMNDVEDQAAKVSAEEQVQLTTIHTFENDLNSAKSQVVQLKKDNEEMVKAKGEICSQILENQRKIASLESDSSTLSQTLELIQQERTALSAKLTEKRNYYIKVTEDMNIRLQEQKECYNSLMTSIEAGKQGMVKDKLDKQIDITEEVYSFDNLLTNDPLENDARKNLTVKLDSAKSKLAEISEMKLKLVMENKKMKQTIEQVSGRANDLKPALMEMDIKTLEEEYNAFLSDKAGETEYLQSLQNQVDKLKGISHVVRCACGEEYRVHTDICT